MCLLCCGTLAHRAAVLCCCHRMPLPRSMSRKLHSYTRRAVMLACAHKHVHMHDERHTGHCRSITACADVDETKIQAAHAYSDASAA